MSLVLAIALLLTANLLNNRWRPQWYTGTCVTVSVTLVVLALADGTTWADLGLDMEALRSGLAWGAVLVAAVGAVFAIGLALPWTRTAFHDDRAGELSGREVAWRVLVRVPFGTVLLEEAAFRGVLLALVARDHGTAWAVAVSSALFGLWHVLPSMRLNEDNEAVGAVLGGGGAGRWRTVALSVVGTAAAGVLFCWLRLAAGLLAPVALHWALNGLGYWLGWRASRPREISRPPEINRPARRSAGGSPAPPPRP